MNLNNYKFFFHALRTALIFIATLLTYEILKTIENEWNKTHPTHKLYNFTKRKIFHFIIIFITDLLILYSIALLFKVHL
jgi:hypothetical protein